MKTKLLVTAVMLSAITFSTAAMAQVNVGSNSWSQSNSTSSVNNTNVNTPGLAAGGGNQSCAGSRSFGFSMLGMGISGGSTYEMEGCEGRNDALVLHTLGQTNAGLLRLCKDNDVAIALAYDGKPCPPEYYNVQQRKMIFPQMFVTDAPRNATPQTLANTQGKRVYDAERNVWYYPN